MEDFEFSEFGAADLEGVAEAAGLHWHHLPIKDVGIPDEKFERLWIYSGHVLRRKQRSGEKIVLHCRGGLGRTGTIAAHLLIECEIARKKLSRAFANHERPQSKPSPPPARPDRRGAWRRPASPEVASPCVSTRHGTAPKEINKDQRRRKHCQAVGRGGNDGRTAAEEKRCDRDRQGSILKPTLD